jgi:putative flippase GtrA
MKKPATQACIFAIAGAVGFLVDAGILYLTKAQLGLYGGRALSFVCAASTTWVINRTVTFAGHHSGKPLLQEYLSYLLLMCGGGIVNYGAYAAGILVSPTVKTHPVIGIAMGSLAGLAVNFVSSKFLLFQNRTHSRQ